jgi:septal ring factor EnvC (AmiA/AmiB activator)
MRHLLIFLFLLITYIPQISAQTNAEIKALQKEQQNLKKQIADSERLLMSTKNDVKSQLNNLMLIEARIGEQQRYIKGVERIVKDLRKNIQVHEKEINRLTAELNHCKIQYQRAVLYMFRNKITQSTWKFVLAAEDYRTMYRRMRYVTEFSKYQRIQGEIIQEKEKEVRQEKEALNKKKRQQEALLKEGKKVNEELKSQQAERKTMVNKLKKKQKQINTTLAQQKKKNQQLNQRIEQAIQKEIEAAEKRRKEAERLAKQKNNKNQQKAEKLKEDVAAQNKLAATFEANKGKFSAPITGGYVISGHFGKYKVQDLKNVELDNKGINLTGKRGAKARSIFEGRVSNIFVLGGLYNVIISHGKYITVYCNLSKVSVKQGQTVKAHQTLGTVASDENGNATLQFQIRMGKQKLNPQLWLMH